MQQPDELALTPIYAAIKDNDITQLVSLIDQWYDVEEPHLQHSNPLHYAISIGRTEAVGILLKAGADPERPDKDGNIPLQQAIFRISNIENDPYNLNLEQISLDLINSGADIANPIIQNDARCRGKYHLMVKLLKSKPENLNIEGVFNLLHDPSKDRVNDAFFDPIKSYCVALYLFKSAVENNINDILIKLNSACHYPGVTALPMILEDEQEKKIYSKYHESKIKSSSQMQEEHLNPSIYSSLKCKHYDSKLKLARQIEEFKEFRLSKEVLETNFHMRSVYEQWIRPTLSLLKMIHDTTSPLDYLQTRIEKLSGQQQEFGSIPHAIKILEFLSSQDTIRLAPISKNPFALFFPIKATDTGLSDHHDDQNTEALKSINIGKCDDKPNEEIL